VAAFMPPGCWPAFRCGASCAASVSLTHSAICSARCRTVSSARCR
jgi:hypothetical protein